MQSGSSARGRSRGFTLIELMITLAILAIIIAIALPSYRSYVLRSHRADGLATLTQDQAILERCYAQNYAYDAPCAALPAFPQTSPQGFYSIALVTQAAPAAGYTLTATTIGSQVADTTCARMTLDQANQKNGYDTNGVAQAACWNP